MKSTYSSVEGCHASRAMFHFDEFRRNQTSFALLAASTTPSTSRIRREATPSILRADEQQKPGTLERRSLYRGNNDFCCAHQRTNTAQCTCPVGFLRTWHAATLRRRHSKHPKLSHTKVRFSKATQVARMFLYLYIVCIYTLAFQNEF